MNGYITTAFIDDKNLIFGLKHQAPWRAQPSRDSNILFRHRSLQVPTESNVIEWLHLNVIPKKPLITLTCYDRETTASQHDVVLVCSSFYSKGLIKKDDIAALLLKQGLVSVQDDDIALKKAKSYAQCHRLGIWSSYKEEKLIDRAVSESIRLRSFGWQYIKSKFKK